MSSPPYGQKPKRRRTAAVRCWMRRRRSSGVTKGVFIAMRLMDHFLRRAPGAWVASFQFRAQRPLLDTAPFSLCMATTPAGADLWTLDHSGQLAMLATVETA